jgi:GNAT superfamily N-acetyltransferase
MCIRDSYVVTEYGAAELRGKTVSERALALINVAHPKFREGLLEYAKSYGYIKLDQPSTPYSGLPYPGRYETTGFFENKAVLFRPVKPTDEEMMKELFYSFSERTIYQRFMAPKKRLPQDELKKFVNIDYSNRMAIGAFIKEADRCRMVGLAGYDLDRTTNTAEISLVVLDEWQNRGIGTFMMEKLIDVGRDRGITAFTAEVMVDNATMRDILYRSGLEVKTTLVDDVYMMRMGLHPSALKKAT